MKAAIFFCFSSLSVKAQQLTAVTAIRAFVVYFCSTRAFLATHVSNTLPPSVTVDSSDAFEGAVAALGDSEGAVFLVESFAPEEDDETDADDELTPKGSAKVGAAAKAEAAINRSGSSKSAGGGEGAAAAGVWASEASPDRARPEGAARERVFAPEREKVAERGCSCVF